jgi:hypothetical protein
MTRVILLTLINIFGLFTVFNLMIASRKYPGEDPRQNTRRLSMLMMVVRLLVLGAVFSFLFGLMKTLVMLNTYVIITTVIFAFIIIYLFYINRRFGWNRMKRS